MKVSQIETTVLEMPYTKPLVTATNNFTVARGVLARVIIDTGLEGYGYADLFPRTGEVPETARHAIDLLKPKVVGRELGDSTLRCAGEECSRAALSAFGRPLSERNQSHQDGERG